MVKQVGMRATHLEEDEHEYGVGTESDESRRPALEEERRAFLAQRSLQDIERRHV